MYFYTGVLIYYYFDAFMRYKWWVLCAGIILSLSASGTQYLDILVYPLSIGSIIIWLSMVGKWGTFEGKKDNVSYNMYLLHAPVIQLLVYTGIVSTTGMWRGFILSIILITALSVAINALIEKPIKRKFS